MEGVNMVMVVLLMGIGQILMGIEREVEEEVKITSN